MQRSVVKLSVVQEITVEMVCGSVLEPSVVLTMELGRRIEQIIVATMGTNDCVQRAGMVMLIDDNMQEASMMEEPVMELGMGMGQINVEMLLRLEASMEELTNANVQGTNVVDEPVRKPSMELGRCVELINAAMPMEPEGHSARLGRDRTPSRTAPRSWSAGSGRHPGQRWQDCHAQAGRFAGQAVQRGGQGAEGGQGWLLQEVGGRP